MPRQPCRRFTLFDAMILIAATGMGFGLIRLAGIDLGRVVSMPPTSKSRFEGGANFLARGGTYVLVPVLATWTPALIAIRLKHRRPERRRLFRQPGVVAACAALMAILAELAFVAGLKAGGQREYLSLTAMIVPRLRESPAFSVAGAWLTLALSGRWRREPGWIDSVGILLGSIWIGVQLLQWATYVMAGF